MSAIPNSNRLSEEALRASPTPISRHSGEGVKACFHAFAGMTGLAGEGVVKIRKPQHWRGFQSIFSNASQALPQATLSRHNLRHHLRQRHRRR